MFRYSRQVPFLFLSQKFLEHSTAKEIKGIFESAINSFKHYLNAQMLREACSVFLDEGGLPTGKITNYSCCSNFFFQNDSMR